MEERLKRLRNEWKQRLSWVLICVMLIQTVISGKALPVFASSSWEEITDNVSATPADAFSRIEISAGNVNHDGKFRFSLKASLNSDTLIGYAEEQYAEHGDGETLLEDWAAAADDSILPPAEFRFRLSSRDGIKLGEMKGSLIADGIQEIPNGETIGSYQFKKNGDQNLTAIFKIKKRYAYAYYDVKFGASFDFSASGAKEEDEVNIEVKPDGVVELSLAGGGENPEPGEESGYELIKTGPQSVTGTEIEYTITARVKPQAATASSLRMATDSGIATDSGMATSSELSDEIALEEYIELMEMKYPPDNEYQTYEAVSYTHIRAHETSAHL